MLRNIITLFRPHFQTSLRLSSNSIRPTASSFSKFPTAVQGVYDPRHEKDSCGVGIVAHLKKNASRQIVLDANQMLVRMSHGCLKFPGLVNSFE